MATTSDESFDVDDKSNGNSSFFTPLENSFELSNDASNSEIKQSGSTIVNSDSEFDEGNEAELTKLMEQRKQRRLSRRSQRFTALPSDSEDDDEVIESSLVEMNLVSDDDNEIPETDDGNLFDFFFIFLTVLYNLLSFFQKWSKSLESNAIHRGPA